MKFLTAAMIAIAGAGVLPAAAQDMNMNMKMKPGMEMSVADKGYMDAMRKMQRAMMGMELTGDPDGDFVRMMIAHHQSAVDMAEALLKEDNVDPAIKAMAEQIIASQKKEIDEFNKWLAANPQ